MSGDKNWKTRWEFCPYCFSGWTQCQGKTKDGLSWAYVCTHDDCEAYFTVRMGEGEMDKRIGMQLSDKVLYWYRCDTCSKEGACRVINLRMICTACDVVE